MVLSVFFRDGRDRIVRPLSIFVIYLLCQLSFFKIVLDLFKLYKGD